MAIAPISRIRMPNGLGSAAGLTDDAPVSLPRSSNGGPPVSVPRDQRMNGGGDAAAPISMPRQTPAGGGLAAAAQLGSGGQSTRSFDDWARLAAPQVNDSVETRLNQITSRDSPTMQMARADGLRTASARGVLNSSMSAGAAQDSVIRNALPIASQDASQAFQKNMAATNYTYGMASQFAGQEATRDENALNRALELQMQTNTISAADRQQIRQIASTEGLAAADRALQEVMQGRQIASTEGMQRADIGFQTSQNALNRDLQFRMQAATLSAADQQQIRDIQSREGQAAADRALQTMMQTASLTAAERQQQADIAFQTTQRGLDRDAQRWLATANLNSSDRNAAAQFLTNMETMYQTSYQSIMANTALSAEQRTAQLAAARSLRDRQLDFVQQMYDVQLDWGQLPAASGSSSTTTSTPTPAATTSTASSGSTTTPSPTPMVAGAGVTGGRNAGDARF